MSDTAAFEATVTNLFQGLTFNGFFACADKNSTHVPTKVGTRLRFSPAQPVELRSSGNRSRPAHSTAAFRSDDEAGSRAARAFSMWLSIFAVRHQALGGILP
jgi:hypothetical protein